MAVTQWSQNSPEVRQDQWLYRLIQHSTMAKGLVGPPICGFVLEKTGLR